MGSCEDTTVFTSVLPHLLSQLSNLLYLSLSSLHSLHLPLFFSHPRRRVPCCWRRVCTTSRQNSCAAPPLTRLPGHITATCCPSTSTPSRPRPRPRLAPPLPPSLCTVWAWWSTAARLPTPWTRAWRTSSWPLRGAAAQCCAVAPRHCRRAWWSSLCATSWRSWLLP